MKNLRLYFGLGLFVFGGIVFIIEIFTNPHPSVQILGVVWSYLQIGAVDAIILFIVGAFFMFDAVLGSDSDRELALAYSVFKQKLDEPAKPVQPPEVLDEDINALIEDKPTMPASVPVTREDALIASQEEKCPICLGKGEIPVSKELVLRCSECGGSGIKPKRKPTVVTP